MVYTKVMIMVSIVDMKAKLSTYVERAARGEQILICRHNRPVAELRPVGPLRTQPRPLGPLPGRPTFEVPASFFEPMAPDEWARWEGVATSDPLTSKPPGLTRRPTTHNARRRTRTAVGRRARSKRR